MTLKKVTTYIDEDLLRSVKVLAFRSDSKIYEVFNEALKRYLKEADAMEPPLAEPSLAEALRVTHPSELPECLVRAR